LPSSGREQLLADAAGAELGHDEEIVDEQRPDQPAQ
jgi:hypothetical protein